MFLTKVNQYALMKSMKNTNNKFSYNFIFKMFGYDIISTAKELATIQSLSKKNFFNEQIRKRDAIVKHHYINTSWYRKFIGSNEKFVWENIPIINKGDLQNFSLGGIFQIGAAMDEGFNDFVKNHKLSCGLEFRMNGFSFYSYPTAIGYEYHQPINDADEKGKHYFTLLFDY